MKAICLNFQEIRKNHFIYALYIIHTLQKKYSNQYLKCLLHDSTKVAVNACGLSDMSFNQADYQKEISDSKMGADIKWNGISNIVTKIEGKPSKLTIRSSKKNQLVSRSSQSKKWLLYEEANMILRSLNIKDYGYLDFVKAIPKKDWVKKLVDQSVDKNKTIMYISILEKECSKQAEHLIKHWIKKILETESVCIVLKSNIMLTINHPQLFTLKEESVSYYDEIQLINEVDMVVGMAGDIEQVAVFLKKPIFLFISDETWSINNNACWAHYLKLCNIRNIANLENSEITRLAEKAYLLFSDLIYNVNLNIKLSTEQLQSLHYVVENPIAMLFFNDEEKEEWREKNIDYEQWIIPLLKQRWTLKEVRKLVRKCNVHKLAYICGNITWNYLIIFKLMAWQAKVSQSIKWINNQYYKYVPVENLIEGLHIIKEKGYHGK